GDMIFFLTSFGAEAAANAPVDVNGHGPFMFGRVITFGGGGGDEDLLDGSFGRAGDRGGEQAGKGGAQRAENTAPGTFFAHGTSEGAWGTWHSVHSEGLEPGFDSTKWFLLTICLCHFGREGLASWHRMQAA